MDYETYRKNYFVDPPPAERFDFVGVHGTTLYYQDYDAAVDYYEQVLGPPTYVEGNSTKGWRIGDTWLTLLRGIKDNPKNVEIQIVMSTPAEAEKLQRMFIEAGGVGLDPSDQLMYEPIRSCLVTDPFGTDLMIFSRL